jgi:peptide subunit release factor 1 (eRF1)
VLAVLRDHRVRLLAIDGMFNKPGVRCGGCGALSETPWVTCASCGGTGPELADDVIEPAIEQALAQRAAFELVRSAPARRLMTGRGPMAALLRW